MYTAMVAILNLLDLRSITKCLGGMNMIRYIRSVFTCAFRANVYLTFPRKRLSSEKKDCCAMFGCNNDRLFPKKYTVKFSFCPKSVHKY